MYCRQCGAYLGNAPTTCGRCGWDPAQETPVATLVPTYDVGQDAGMRLLLPVGRSIWAIAAGYAGLFAFIFFPAPLAIILGIVAIRDIKKHPEKHGMGRAIFGLVAGIVGTIGLVGMIVALSLSGRHF